MLSNFRIELDSPINRPLLVSRRYKTPETD